MNIIFVTTTPFPNGMAATNRIRNYCLGLLANNIKPEVLVIRSTEKTDKKGINPTSGEWKGIGFRYPTTSIRSTSFFKRRIDDVRDLYKAIRVVYTSKHEVVYVYMNSLIMELLTIVAAKCSGKKIVRELCEYPYYRDCFNSKLNLKLLKYYNGIVAISQELEDIAKKHTTNTSIIKVPILIDSKSRTNEKHINKKPYIFHGGTLTENKDGIISTMRAFALANKELKNSVDFILAGPHSPDMAVLQQIILENKLQDNVKFLGKITAEEIEEYLNGASLCILNKNDTLQNRCGFSTKLGEILSSETAVITTTIGEANLWLQDGESAFITEPHRPELIANLIVRAFENEVKRCSIARKGKEIALNNFAISTQGPRLANFISTKI